MRACNNDRLKMRKQGGKWIVEDKGRTLTFDNSLDAWGYVFIMRKVYPNAPTAPKTLYPVLSLTPAPIKRKNVVFAVEWSERV